MQVILLTISCVHGPQVTVPDNVDSDHSVELDADAFDSMIVVKRETAVVEFYSPTCMACQAMSSIYDSIGIVYGDSLLVARVDADEQKKLTEVYSVKKVPSFAYFSNGEIIRVESMAPDDSTFDTLSERIRHLLAGTLTPVDIDTGDKKDTIPSGYLTLDSLSFDTTVLRPGRVAMVFFMVPAGIPCIHMDSVVSEIVPQFEGRAVIAKVEVVWNVEPLSQRYGIDWVPRFLFFKDGEQVVEEQRGNYVEGDTLAAVLERLLEE